MSALLLLALACGACRRGAEAPVEGPAGGPSPPAPAGEVVDGRYVDQRWGFTLPLLEGWSASPGPDTGSLRVALVDAETGARVEVWAFVDLGDTPRPRSDCTWTWVGDAPFRATGPRGHVTAATCTPWDPEGPRVHAWLLPGHGVGIQAEVHVPPGALRAARRRGEALLAGLRP